MAMILRESLEMGLKMAARGDSLAAIEVLDAALGDALASHETVWVSLIGRNLAIVCEHVGQTMTAVNYLLRVLDEMPSDRSTLYHLANLLVDAGDEARADLAFLRCLDLSLRAGDNELLALLELKGYSRGG